MKKYLLLIVILLFVLGCGNSSPASPSAITCHSIKIDSGEDYTIHDISKDIIVRAYGSVPGDENWNPGSDLDCSGKVDDSDVLILNVILAREGSSQR